MPPKPTNGVGAAEVAAVVAGFPNKPDPSVVVVVVPKFRLAEVVVAGLPNEKLVPVAAAPPRPPPKVGTEPVLADDVAVPNDRVGAALLAGAADEVPPNPKLVPVAAVDAAGAPKLNDVPKAGADVAGVAPKDGVLVVAAPKAGVDVAAPKDGVEVAAPKAGVDVTAPKAGAAVEAPKVGGLDAAAPAPNENPDIFMLISLI